MSIQSVLDEQNKCEIVCVIDRSGSMDSVKDDAIGGFNTFLEEQQKQPGNAVLTYVQFDNEYEIVHNQVDLEDVPELTESTYVPRGGTALNDAIGRTISEVASRNPNKVIMCILTDGQENSSQEFTTEQVKEKIKEKEDEGWEFLFLSASPDAWGQSMSYGFNAQNTVTFAANSIGTQSAYHAMSDTVSMYRADSNTTIEEDTNS